MDMDVASQLSMIGFLVVDMMARKTGVVWVGSEVAVLGVLVKGCRCMAELEICGLLVSVLVLGRYEGRGGDVDDGCFGDVCSLLLIYDIGGGESMYTR